MLTTPRLILRDWRDSDLEPFAALNADPEVMAHFPSRLTRDESDASAARIRAGIADRGFGFWAVEVPGAADFIGFIGLSVPSFDAPFMPAVEIGWRLARSHWGHGYASEGARAALRFGFETLELETIVAFTVPGNWRSRRVMSTVGMTHDTADDFDHPKVADPACRRHVLYRLAEADWRARQAGEG